MENETLRTFRTLMRWQGHVTLRASGYSMYPYIRPGDVCRFLPAIRPLEAGQVGLVVSDSGVLFSHRLQRPDLKSRSEGAYRFRGDMNDFYDNPVPPSQVIGVLTELRRRGKTLTENRRRRRMWTKLAVKGDLLFRIFAYLSGRIIRKSAIKSFHRRSGHWTR